MRRISQVILLICFSGLLANCSNSKNRTRTLTATDSLWLNFATAIDDKDLDFLLANSLDSISCVDCELSNSSNDRKTYQTGYLINNLLDELRHLDTLSVAEFSTFKDSTSIKVNYSIKSNNAPEGGYNLIFILQQVDGNYLLAERIFVP